MKKGPVKRGLLGPRRGLGRLSAIDPDAAVSDGLRL
jgi:hypothetical protein